MQKLTGISSGQNNKSCSIIHLESNKICFAFFDFSMIFYAIYKNQPKGFTIWVDLLQQGPWKESESRNVVPGGRAAAVRPNSGQPPAEAGRARAGEGP
jgi:hypothetical protein